jgi:RHS repeat-associated protein
MDRVATRTDPLLRVETFAYDGNGNVTSVTDRKGRTTTYAYDALARVTFGGFGTTGSPPTYASTITTTYDAGDRVTSVADSGAGTITPTYDLLDRLTSEVTPEGTVSYSYDAADRRTTMTVAGQPTVTYSYDDADRLTGIVQGSSAVGMAYDAEDRRTTLTLPNGIVAESAYDAAAQLVGITYRLGPSTLGTLTYSYDGKGQRTGVGGTWARTGLPPAVASATYDNANQIVTWGGTPLSYDANGNLTNDGTRSYTWNARDQLTAVVGPQTANFAYDGLSRRRAKTVGTATTQFLYDRHNVVRETAVDGTTANLLTSLSLDEVFTRNESTASHLLSDALGSTVGLTDAAGAVATTYTYEPFGATAVSGSGTNNATAFTGRESDGTGLYFYRARYYSPLLQRFISDDPLGFAAGDVNLAGYVFNDPTNQVDPWGLVRFVIPRLPPPLRGGHNPRIPRVTPDPIPRQVPHIPPDLFQPRNPAWLERPMHWDTLMDLMNAFGRAFSDNWPGGPWPGGMFPGSAPPAMPGDWGSGGPQRPWDPGGSWNPLPGEPGGGDGTLGGRKDNRRCPSIACT